jgi:S1-C subfamily serine protease
LVNLHGDVVGVSTAIATRTGQYDGVGFAIPSRRVRALVDDLISGGPGMLGVWVGSAAHPELRDRAAAAGWKQTGGALVTEVMPGRPADEAGVRTGDIILRVDDETIGRMEDLIRIVSARQPGTNVHLEIWRDAGRIELDVRVGRRYAPVPPRVGS